MSEITPEMREKIEASFAAQSMLTSLGARLVGLAAGWVAVEAEIAPTFHQQQGFAHGGTVFTLADVAAGYAALTLMDAKAEVMTAEVKINFLTPAKGLLRAEGRVLKAGRRLVVVASEVVMPPSETMVAALQGTMVPVRRRSDP